MSDLDRDTNARLDELKRRHPFLLAAPRIRPGWLPAIEALLEDLAAIPGVPRIYQLERRTYGLRACVLPDDEDDAGYEAARATIERYSRDLEHRCEICGADRAVLQVAGDSFVIACPTHISAQPVRA